MMERPVLLRRGRLYAPRINILPYVQVREQPALERALV